VSGSSRQPGRILQAAGHYCRTTSGEDYATVAYNTATGAQQWVKRYTSSAPSRTDVALWVAVSPTSGTVFVTGYSYGVGTYDFATVAYQG
jgi:hypothetical protein